MMYSEAVALITDKLKREIELANKSNNDANTANLNSIIGDLADRHKDKTKQEFESLLPQMYRDVVASPTIQAIRNQLIFNHMNVQTDFDVDVQETEDLINSVLSHIIFYKTYPINTLRVLNPQAKDEVDQLESEIYTMRNVLVDVAMGQLDAQDPTDLSSWMLSIIDKFNADLIDKFDHRITAIIAKYCGGNQ